MGEIARPQVADARRIVLKIGTRVLTHPDGTTALSRLFGIVETAARLRRDGRQVLLVTSGAVGLGRAALRMDEPPTTPEIKQLCAAVGQSRLMELYQQGFARLGVVCAQILITWTDFDDPLRYRNLHETLENLIEYEVVPVINENDAISLNDRAYRGTGKRPIFDDNDRLSALVASELAADLLVLLTDVPGVMTADPRQDRDARLVERIDDPDRHGVDVSSEAAPEGRGGMASKVEAAAVAARGGCHTIIASGVDPGALARVLAGEPDGTWIPARPALSPRTRWIAYCSHPKGTLFTTRAANGGPREGEPLRAVAITGAEGEFRRGDVVEIKDADGTLLGRGVVGVGAGVVAEWIRANGEPGRAGGGERLLIAAEHLVLAGGRDG